MRDAMSHCDIQDVTSQATLRMCTGCERRRHFGCVQECSILKSLNYDKNIVQFFGAVLRPGVEPMLVLEFMEV